MSKNQLPVAVLLDLQKLAFNNPLANPARPRRSQRLLVVGFVALPPLASVFGPSRARRAAKNFTSFFGADVPPPCCAQPHGRAVDRRWREFPAREIEDLECQIQQRLWWQTSLANDVAQPRGSARSKHPREFGGEQV
jgi:hypothetical protein